MPLGMLGKYNQHDRVSNEVIDGDMEVANFYNGGHSITYLGEQSIAMFVSKNVADGIDKIYNQNYSPLSAIMHLRKFNLVINSDGISVVQPASRKFAAKIILHYQLQDLLFITTDWKHHKALALVLKSSPKKAALHVYLCISREQANTIIEECFDEFKNLKEVKYSSYPVSLEIVQSHPEASSCSLYHNTLSKIVMDDFNNEKSLSDVTIKDDKETVKTEEFGGFQSSAVAKLVDFDADESSAVREKPVKFCPEVRNEVEDEFALFALNRNKHLPNHQQDRSVGPSLMMQENASIVLP